MEPVEVNLTRECPVETLLSKQEELTSICSQIGNNSTNLPRIPDDNLRRVINVKFKLDIASPSLQAIGDIESISSRYPFDAGLTCTSELPLG
jgi:hypothetical protein